MRDVVLLAADLLRAIVQHRRQKHFVAVKPKPALEIQPERADDGALDVFVRLRQHRSFQLVRKRRVPIVKSAPSDVLGDLGRKRRIVAHGRKIARRGRRHAVRHEVIGIYPRPSAPPKFERGGEALVPVLARKSEQGHLGDDLVRLAPLAQIDQAVSAYDKDAVAVLVDEPRQHEIAVMHRPVAALDGVDGHVRPARDRRLEHRDAVEKVGGATLVRRVCGRNEDHALATERQSPLRHLDVRGVRRIECASEQRRTVQRSHSSII